MLVGSKDEGELREWGWNLEVGGWEPSEGLKECVKDAEGGIEEVARGLQ